MKNIATIAILATVILVSGCIQEGTTDLAGTPSGEIGMMDPYDTTCGGAYDSIPNGTTDNEGKHILKLETEQGTIFIKDAVTNEPVENIEMVFLVSCGSLETTSVIPEFIPETRTLSQVNFQLLENEKYNTDVGTGAFTTTEGVVFEVTYLIISKTANVPDAESAIEIAEQDSKVQDWSSKFDKVGSSARVRVGKWQVDLEGWYEECPKSAETPSKEGTQTTPPSYGIGTGGCSGGILSVFVDPDTGEVTDYFESNP